MKSRLKISFLLFVLALTGTPLYADAAIYSYVDKNGKTQYTNMAPPRAAKAVKKTKEIMVDKAIVEERLEQKQLETKESYEWEKEQQREAEQLATEKRKEQNRINRRIQQEKREQKAKIREEKKYMLAKQKNWLSNCDSLKVGFLIVQKCRDRVKKRTKQDLRFLTKTTRSYFIHKFSNRYDTDRYFDEMYDSLFEKYKN